ncbi:MAG: zinc-binding alcohol dehydrogenase family protein [Polyangiaceae bacterium]|nr:zinc-binding alcohol dehydrogenase family protein [Polyangiaceae bacterium]
MLKSAYSLRAFFLRGVWSGEAKNAEERPRAFAALHVDARYSSFDALTMKAWVIHRAGGPDQFSLEEVPTPQPRDGWVLLRVRAFGLNRSEYFTRRGESPTVQFPRVLGIECVGEVVHDGGCGFEPGQQVAALMNGMGRAFDGSYAEFTLVPAASVLPFHSELPWEELALYPEMLQTCFGSLHVGLEVEPGLSLLVRGGTSSIGLATLALGKSYGLRVGMTSRSPSRRGELLDAGADEVWIDDGALALQLSKAGRVYDRVLELVGTTTLLDSLRCVSRGGIVCMTGILGGAWSLSPFEPMGDIPTGVKLTSYSGETADLPAAQLQQFLDAIASGRLTVQRGPCFDFEDLREAHGLMDRNQAAGKIVVRGVN